MQRAGLSDMDEAVIARAIHVTAVVNRIGGAAMANTVLLPLMRRKGAPAETRLALLEAVEGRFVWQARIATVLAALSGLYMIQRHDLWTCFASPEFWWMHVMLAAG
jgi:uncharacterized membrane protein